MDPLDLVKLAPLMERTSGSPQVRVGLIDGPVVTQHPDLAREYLQEIPGNNGATCTQANSTACVHGTFVAGILSAKKSSAAPAICPSCTLVIRPIFSERAEGSERMPSATPQELAKAILDCLEAGARVLNLSVALSQPSTSGERVLETALNEAGKRGAVVISAAGNQRTLGSTAITRHPCVIPVVAYDLQGKPLEQSTLGISIGRRGLGAPGDKITSLGTEGKPLTLGGTSAAAPFVTGAIALLWSEFPHANAIELKFAMIHASSGRRASVVPPLLNAWGAYQYMLAAYSRRRLP
jgi:subtilisin family serine protease